ncbi:MAG: rhodanese-like domain-containing protein [Candidatus Eisenbacteria bacterium]
MRPLLLLLACVGLAPTVARADTPAGADTVPVTRVGATQALLAFKRGTAVLVDVRYPGQRALGHVDGDIAMPFDQVAAHHDRLPADKKLIFYCSCPHEEEALEAARAMPRPADPRVAVLVGGFDAWRKAGGPVKNEATWEGVFRVDAEPVGWGKTPTEHGRCQYLRDSTVASRGLASGCVVCGAPDSTALSLAGFSQRTDAEPLRGRTVTLSGMVRTDGVVGAALLWIGAEADQGKLLAFARSDSTPVIGTSDWRPVEITLRVPPDARLLDFGLHLVGVGRAWLDDVRLIAPAENGLPRYRVVIANEGFEE